MSRSIKRILRGGVAILAVRIYSIALAILLMFFLAKWMEPKQLGSFVVGSNLQFFISLIGMLGLNQSLIRIVAGRDRALSWQDVGSIINWAWLFSSVGGVLVGAISGVALNGWLGNWLNCVDNTIFPIVVGSFLLSAHKILSALLRSVHYIGSSALFDGRLGGPVPNTAFAIAAFLFSGGKLTASQALWIFDASLLVTFPVGWLVWVIAWRAASKDIVEQTVLGEKPVHTKSAPIEKLYRESIPYLIAQIAIFFCGEFDVWLASAYATQEETAMFGYARRLIVQIQQPLAILTATLSSSIAELYARGALKELERMVRISTTLIVIVTLPALLFCIVAPQFVMGLFGESYRAGGYMLAILSVGQIANCVTGQCGQVLLMAGKVRITIIINVFCGFVLLIGGNILAKQYGILGLTIVSAIVTSLQYVLMWIFVRYQVGIWSHPGFDFGRIPFLSKIGTPTATQVRRDNGAN